jgi:hypothetical protein
MTDRRTKKRYLEKHLYNELRWLLCAATEWHIQNTINEYLYPKRQQIVGYHMQLYTLDSVALHARALFEFLTHTATPNYYGANTYLGGDDVIASTRFNLAPPDQPPHPNDWSGPLHSYLMHLQSRPGTRRKLPIRANARNKLHLKEMPVQFAEEIIDLWQQFCKELRDGNQASLATEAERALAKAIDAARRVRTNEVTKHILKTKLPKGFPIPLLSWERSPRA